MPALHYETAYFRELFLGGPLIEVARQILAPEVALFTTHFTCKRPSDGLSARWQQNAAFFPIEPMETFTL